MRKITAADTLELSIQERILLVEDIWDTIASESDAVTLSDNEKAIIDERLEAYHANPELGSPWEDVFARITSKKNGK